MQSGYPDALYDQESTQCEETERRETHTTDGIVAAMQFLSITETRVEACSDALLLSGASSLLMASSVSMTLARMS